MGLILYSAAGACPLTVWWSSMQETSNVLFLLSVLAAGWYTITAADQESWMHTLKAFELHILVISAPCLLCAWHVMRIFQLEKLLPFGKFGSSCEMFINQHFWRGLVFLWSYTSAPGGVLWLHGCVIPATQNTTTHWLLIPVRGGILARIHCAIIMVIYPL